MLRANFWSEESYEISTDKIQKPENREIIGVHWESLMKHITTLCGKNIVSLCYGIWYVITSKL